MLTSFRDLLAHKRFANTALLDAIRHTPAAVEDRELLQLLEHVRVSNRFWLVTILGQPFDYEREARASASFDELVDRFRHIAREEGEWVSGATEEELRRTLEGPLIPNGQCSVGDALMQVVLHSHGHRAQCATLLRRDGGEPPVTDYIMWVRQQF